MLLAMTEELSHRTEEILAGLLSRSEGESVYLCDRGGNIIAQSSNSLYPHEENMAALAAGSFFATRELAKLLGEPEFHCVFHQGDRNSVYMQSTTFDMLLLVIFGEASNPGLVRLYATESTEELDALLGDGPSKTEHQDLMASQLFEIDDTKQAFQRAAGGLPS